MAFSTEADFDKAYQSVRTAFDNGKTKPKAWRRQQLKRTWWMIEDNKDRIADAIYKDLHKHIQESRMADIAAAQDEILDTLKHLDEWTKDEKPSRTNILNFLGGATVRKEPLGVTLIIGAWNYPMLLLLSPMIAAIGAGCAMILKPSDMATASQELLMEIIPQYLDQDAIQIISAGPAEMGRILTHRFDHIFYTGSPNVAKIVYTAAAKHLTPVTLELGGQGPSIVAKTADIDLTAKHIAATKFMNAGQICLNVNHVFADPSIRGELVEKLGKYFDLFSGGQERPEHYTHIVNDRNFNRLENLLSETKGQVVYGGKRDKQTRYFSPTIVTDVKPGDSLLSEELFGPMLPIIDADLDTAIKYTRSGEHPLAIYAFTKDTGEKERILEETRSGGVTFNDCVLHVAAHDAPFGGVGNSGMGYYHGRYGILTFSHLRTYINAMPSWMEPLLDARYPPYTVAKSNKMSPPSKPTFDREGNDLSSGASFKIAGLAVMIASIAYARSRGWNGSFIDIPSYFK
ncbi:aldehyde dehydrogenase [Parastagonospora nodorum]|nr:aldehyde dehydrogenase [Parastagonospora nodorum]KAH4659481.1 aldehyde dehydrogenase [Parastagonospora nodorum]KAH4692750.1 aldehyde dehydrogenase [Parastagonospora nodorum]KAH4751694.1 aldehyde dehydrogenase [Parastagonospora nodorum]KAH4769579.1 aldehyde dehydrogenase [Parastagonospora nodorum]